MAQLLRGCRICGGAKSAGVEAVQSAVTDPLLSNQVAHLFQGLDVALDSSLGHAASLGDRRNRWEALPDVVCLVAKRHQDKLHSTGHLKVPSGVHKPDAHATPLSVAASAGLDPARMGGSGSSRNHSGRRTRSCQTRRSGSASPHCETALGVTPRIAANIEGLPASWMAFSVFMGLKFSRLNAIVQAH